MRVLCFMLVILLLINFVKAATQDPVVPLFSWRENSKIKSSSIRSPNIPAVNQASVDNLYNNLDGILAHKVFMFVTDSLSPEDISMNTFPHMQRRANHGRQVYYPAVKNGAQLSDKLRMKGYTIKSLSGSVAENEIDSGPDKIVYLVDLQSQQGNNRPSSLMKIDEIIEEIVSLAGDDYTAILTGWQPAYGIESEIYHRRSRSLLSTTSNDGNGTFYNFSCVFMYLTDLPSIEFSVPRVIIKLPNDPTLQASCPNGTEVTLDYGTVSEDSVNLEGVKIRFVFAIQRDGSWRVTSAMLSLKGKINDTPISDTNLALDMSTVRAPRDNSFHCTKSGLFSPENTNDTKEGVEGIRLPGLQIQPIMNGKGKFGRIYDCAGFFTIPILASLMLTLIIVVILTWAIGMLMSIKTMDRFDDPKGKPIHIPISE